MAGHIGSEYQKEEIGYLTHKAEHALTGALIATAKGEDALSGALGATTGEMVAELTFEEIGSSIKGSSDAGKIAGTLVGLTTGEVQTAANSASTAVDNNFTLRAIQFTGRACFANSVCRNKAFELGEILGISMITTSWLNMTPEQKALFGNLASQVLDQMSLTYKDLKEENEQAAKDGKSVSPFLTRPTTSAPPPSNNDNDDDDKKKGGKKLQEQQVTKLKEFEEAIKKLDDSGVLKQNKDSESEMDIPADAVKINDSYYIRVVSNDDTKIEWGYPLNNQGLPFEDFLSNFLPGGSRLEPGTKTFDFYDEKTATAVSVKTLNNQTDAKINNPAGVGSTLIKYINSMLNFTEARSGKTSIKDSQINTKVIEVAIRPNATDLQYKELLKVAQYAMDNNVKFVLTIVVD